MSGCIVGTTTASAFIFYLLAEICGDKTISDGVVDASVENQHKDLASVSELRSCR